MQNDNWFDFMGLMLKRSVCMHYNYSTMQNDNWFDFMGLMLKRSVRICSPAISSAFDGAVDILGFFYFYWCLNSDI
jgi:nuclear transport factor 2 (NTF2) superfamily protein